MKLSEQCIAVEQSQKLADLGVAQIISTWEGTRTSYSSYAVHVSNDAINWDTYSRSELDMLVDQGISYKHLLSAFTGVEIMDILSNVLVDAFWQTDIITYAFKGSWCVWVKSCRGTLVFQTIDDTCAKALCGALISLIEKYGVSANQVNDHILTWHTVDGLDKPTIIK